MIENWAWRNSWLLFVVGTCVVVTVAALAAVVTVYTRGNEDVHAPTAASTPWKSSAPTFTAQPTPAPVATPQATSTPVPAATVKPDVAGQKSGSGSASRSSSGTKTSAGGTVSAPPKPVSSAAPPTAPAPPAPPTTWMPTQAEVDAAVEAKTGVTFAGLPSGGDCNFENYGTSTGSTGPAYDAISPVRISGTTLAFTAHPIVNGLFVQYYACGL